MRALIGLAVFATIISLGASQTRSVADSMRDLSLEIVAAYERRDTEALKQFYLRQPDALFFWERRLKYSWDEISATMEALVGVVRTLRLRTTDFRSGGAGELGWFAATFHIEREMESGERIESEGRWTVVAEKIGGRWLIVHEHTSYPLPK